MQAAAKARMERQFDEAAALGHDARDMVYVRTGTPGVSRGYYAVCSCGWKATPRSRKVIAASASYLHVVEVLEAYRSGELERRSTWSPAPDSSRIRQVTSDVARSQAS